MMNKIEQFIAKFEAQIITILVCLCLFSFSYTLVLSNRLSNIKNCIEINEIKHDKQIILITDSLQSAIIEMEKKQLEVDIYKIYQLLFEQKQQIKKLENENQKLKDIYNSIDIDRPQF